MLTHEELKKKMLNNPDVKAEYDALANDKPAFYAVSADTYERLTDRLEDIELTEIVREREGQPEIEVDIDQVSSCLSDT